MNSRYERILVALDLERPETDPLLAGLRLASEYSAELRLVSIVRTALLSPDGFFSADIIDRDELIDEARNAMRARVELHSTNAIPADILIGDPGEMIGAVAQTRESNMVVIGARKRSTSERFLGTTATDVLRHADSVDVYACHRTTPNAPTRQVIVAIDGSAITAEFLADSERFLTGSTVESDDGDAHLVCVIPSNAPDKIAIFRESCEKYLQQSRWVTVEVHTERQSVADSLDGIIRERNADLLIIGSGNNLGLGWAIGSTTNAVLHEVSCDVLVIRP